MTAPRLYHSSLYEFDRPQPSYWEATAGHSGLVGEPLQGEETCEVAVIGGGYTGVSTALHLARDFGVEVRVLDAGHIGWGASGRNGGFCSIGGTKVPVETQIARFGLEETRRYYQSQVEAIELVRSLGQDEGIDFWAQGDGEFTVAPSPAAFEDLKQQAAIQRDSLGLDATTLSQDEFCERGYDSPENCGALLIKPTFGLHPLRYIQGLAKAAEQRGAHLHPQSEVLEWRKEGSQHLLITADGRLKARTLVVACNGFMPEHLHDNLAGRSIPAQTNIVVTRPLTDDELAAHSWTTDCPTIDHRNVFCYFRLLPDKRLLLGGRGDSGGSPEASERTVERLRGRIAAMWPHWRNIPIDYTWRGLVCLNNGFRPAIGKFPEDPSVMFGFGYQGNGVNTATWTGRSLAFWYAGSNASDRVMPDHLPALVRGLPKRFFLPALRRSYLRAGLFYYRLKDRLA